MPTSSAQPSNSCFYQQEAGVGCPLTMTFAAVPDACGSSRRSPTNGCRESPPTSTTRRFIPAAQKKGALIGMAMTEKQGGSDVRANTTRARRGARRHGKRISAHRPQVVLSAPMNDAFLMLAQTERGLTCFFVPRLLPGRHAATRSPSSGSRTSSATAPTRRARSNIATRGPGWSAKKAAASRRSSKWSNHTRLDCVPARPP